MIRTEVNFKISIPLFIFRTRNENFSILQPYILTDVRPIISVLKTFNPWDIVEPEYKESIIIFSTLVEIYLNLFWTEFTMTD